MQEPFSSSDLDWRDLGRKLNESAMVAHGEERMPTAHGAYTIMLDNPEAFGYETWPDDMPAVAPGVLVDAYVAEGLA